MIEPLNQMLFLGLNVKLSLNWTQINNPSDNTNHNSSIGCLIQQNGALYRPSFSCNIKRPNVDGVKHRIAMGANYSFDVKNIDIWMTVFCKHNNSSVATVPK